MSKPKDCISLCLNTLATLLTHVLPHFLLLSPHFLPLLHQAALDLTERELPSREAGDTLGFQHNELIKRDIEVHK